MAKEDLKNPNVGAETRYEVRAEIEHQFVKGLLTINGGAAVTLLAFAQAIFDKSPSLTKVAFIGVMLFGTGLFFASLVNYFRYKTALSAQNHDDIKHRWHIRCSYWSRFVSLGCFLFGLFYVCIVGILSI